MKIGSVAGIGVYIHWTFWLLIAVYMMSAFSNQGWEAALYAGAFILSIFGCVVAHEFGHAGAAAYYGIPTADITLLPIGGVARLKRIPEKPIQEFVIALAGPAVNVVIAAVLFVLVVAGIVVSGAAPGLGSENLATESLGRSMQFMDQMIAANVFLVLFNLLPAFPMDGGRVLRSLLAMRMSHLRATQIAARVGRWMALLFVVLAVTTGPWTLLLIAGFVFLAGTAELMSVRVREIAKAQSQSGENGPFQSGAFGGSGYPGGRGGNWSAQVWPSDHWAGRERYDEGDVIDGEVIDGEIVSQPDSPRLPR